MSALALASVARQISLPMVAIGAYFEHGQVGRASFELHDVGGDGGHHRALAGIHCPL